MKRLFALIAAITLGHSAFAELEIISTGHRTADSFKRLSEYFTGDENPGRYSIFRTDPEQRDGFYISLVADDKSQLSEVSTVRLHYIRAGTQEATTVDIPVDQAIDKRRVLVGLTGSEWTDENNLPVAWKVELLDDAGAIVDASQSFLWAEPR